MSSNQRFSTFDTTPFDVSSNISASSGRRRMGIPPFKPAHRDESNGGISILLRPLDAEVICKMSSNWHYHLRYCAIWHFVYDIDIQLTWKNGITTIPLVSM